MKLSEKYRPALLRDIVGQPPVRLLQAFVKNPYSCCFLMEGGPGTGKTTAARALANELGVIGDFHGLIEITSTELTIDRCRELFDNQIRLRPMLGSGWRVIIIEELEACVSLRSFALSATRKIPTRKKNYDRTTLPPRPRPAAPEA